MASKWELTRAWHDNEKPSVEGEFVDGSRQGKWTFWHRNGQVSLVGRFENDKQNGLWTAYHENGKKKKKVERLMINVRTGQHMVCKWSKKIARSLQGWSTSWHLD